MRSLLSTILLNLFPAHETCTVWPTEPIEMGMRVPLGGRSLVEGRDQFSALRAIDPTPGTAAGSIATGLIRQRLLSI